MVSRIWFGGSLTRVKCDSHREVLLVIGKYRHRILSLWVLKIGVEATELREEVVGRRPFLVVPMAVGRLRTGIAGSQSIATAISTGAGGR